MEYVLFLDDEREPSSSLLAQHERVIVCRSYDEAVKVVRENGMPDYVCFDHDLGPESKTGHDFAKWLVERAIYLMEETLECPPVFGYSVHSQNPVGAANIRGVIDGYRKWWISIMKF